MELKVIAYARNGHTDKFGIPRHSREESPILTRIVFEPEYRVAEALRGIEGYSHLWLIWGFNKVEREKTALLKEKRTIQVSGIVRGRIAEEEYGQGGFGYDPVFIPEGYDKTFGELPAEIKNSISHRSRALQALVKLLNS
jgi:hypothetical protein